MPKRWRKPTDRELLLEFSSWCEAIDAEAARRHLYDLGFNEGVAREREKAAKAAARKPKRALAPIPSSKPNACDDAASPDGSGSGKKL